MKSIIRTSYTIGMENNSFFSKVVKFLSQVNKGTQTQLIEKGWMTNQEALKIKVILIDLGIISKKDDKIFLTRKGLNILLYYKMGKLSSNYNKDILNLFLINESN